jgi:hypothetical protein
MPRLLDRFRLRARSLFRSASADESLRRELQTHLAEQIDEYVAAGATPAEARARAMRELGSVALIEEECRDTRRVNVIQNLVQDLRYSLRTLAHQPLLVATAAVEGARGVECARGSCGVSDRIRGQLARSL